MYIEPPSYLYRVAPQWLYAHESNSSKPCRPKICADTCDNFIPKKNVKKKLTPNTLTIKRLFLVFSGSIMLLVWGVSATVLGFAFSCNLRPATLFYRVDMYVIV